MRSPRPHTLQRLLRLEDTVRSRYIDAEFALRCAHQVMAHHAPGTPRDREAMSLARRAMDSILHWHSRSARLQAAVAVAATAPQLERAAAADTFTLYALPTRF